MIFREDINTLTKAAENGDVDRQFFLGICYETGNSLVERNMEKAIEWYTKAALQGHFRAQLFLFDRYFNGNGVKKDLTKAFEWCKMAAEQGIYESQYNLGVCYEQGVGTEKNISLAVKRYRIVAESMMEILNQDE